MEVSTRTWVRISIFNLLLVAVIGALMRYKMGFEFPWFEQRHLQHAHSHFAFTGWISQFIMAVMLSILRPDRHSRPAARAFSAILWVNLLCAYGMVIAFSIQGYGAVSIFFSTLSLAAAVAFSALFWRSSRWITHGSPAMRWFSAALALQILSMAGTGMLTWMMVTHHMPQKMYLASVYWYLHFQYNGWFFFACMGFLMHMLQVAGKDTAFGARAFRWFLFSVIPTYGLSVLWLDLSWWLYVPVIAGALAQTAGWGIVLKGVGKSGGLEAIHPNPLVRLLLMYMAVAVTVKYALQLGSTIPALSDLAFGFRTIVIAYLHLVLLAITSVFLLIHALASGFIPTDRLVHTALVTFVIGVLLNELVLAVQGIASFSYTMIPGAPEMLFVLSVWIVLSLLLLLAGMIRAGMRGL
jgi:hypothetical protein